VVAYPGEWSAEYVELGVEDLSLTRWYYRQTLDGTNVNLLSHFFNKAYILVAFHFSTAMAVFLF